eukprot:scaffold9766_cov268-Amphora_coffeaeformis.AAC.4
MSAVNSTLVVDAGSTNFRRNYDGLVWSVFVHALLIELQFSPRINAMSSLSKVPYHLLIIECVTFLPPNQCKPTTRSGSQSRASSRDSYHVLFMQSS